MLLCGHQQDMEGAGIQTSEEVDWTAAAKQYNNLKEMPSFVAQQRQLDESQCRSQQIARKATRSIQCCEKSLQQLGPANTIEDDSVWNCRNWKAILDLVLARTAGRSTSRDGSN